MKRIPLRAKDGSVRAYALVDDEDFEHLSEWNWSLNPQGYAQRTVTMHAEIMGEMSDHVDRDGLNNRRGNLRPATKAQNAQNLSIRCDSSSGYRGVTRIGSQWMARARVGGTRHYLGRYDLPEQADRVVKAFRAKHMPFSEDAKLAA